MERNSHLLQPRYKQIKAQKKVYKKFTFVDVEKRQIYVYKKLKDVLKKQFLCTLQTRFAILTGEIINVMVRSQNGQPL